MHARDTAQKEAAAMLEQELRSGDIRAAAADCFKVSETEKLREISVAANRISVEPDLSDLLAI